MSSGTHVGISYIITAGYIHVVGQSPTRWQIVSWGSTLNGLKEEELWVKVNTNQNDVLDQWLWLWLWSAEIFFSWPSSLILYVKINIFYRRGSMKQKPSRKLMHFCERLSAQQTKSELKGLQGLLLVGNIFSWGMLALLLSGPKGRKYMIHIILSMSSPVGRWRHSSM